MQAEGYPKKEILWTEFANDYITCNLDVGIPQTTI